MASVRFVVQHDTIYGYNLRIWIAGNRGGEAGSESFDMVCKGDDGSITWEVTLHGVRGEPCVVGQRWSYKYYFYHPEDEGTKNFFEDGANRELLVERTETLQTDVWRQHTEHYLECEFSDVHGNKVSRAAHDRGCPLYLHVWFFPFSKQYVDEWGEVPMELHLKREGQNEVEDCWEHFMFHLKRYRGRFELSLIPLYVTHEYWNVGKVLLAEVNFVMHGEKESGRSGVSNALCGSKWRYQVFNWYEGWVGRRAVLGAPDPFEDDRHLSVRSLNVSVKPNIWCNFTRSDGARDSILYLIHCAQTSIHTSMYNINDPDVAGALVGAFKRGVDVQILTSSKFCQPEWYLNEQFKRFVAEGIPITAIMHDDPDYNRRLVVKQIHSQEDPEDRKDAKLAKGKFFKDSENDLFFKEVFNGETLPEGLELGPLITNHTKFAIFDRSRVVTGSCNWEIRAFDGNSENFVFIEHREVAEVYECMFQSVRGRAPLAVPNMHESSLIKVYYSRWWGQCMIAPFCRAIDAAKQRIDMSMFIIRRLKQYDPGENYGQGKNWDLFDSLIGAKNRGVNIWIILEANCHDGGKYRDRMIPEDKEHRELMAAGIRCHKIRPVHDSNKFACLHHKFMTIDNWITVTGSFNFWGPSLTSDDDLIMIKDNELAYRYQAEMKRLVDWYLPQHSLEFQKRNW